MVTVAQMANMLSASPLVIRRSSPPWRTTTESRLRLKSKGISSTFSYSVMAGRAYFKMASSSGLLMPVWK